MDDLVPFLLAALALTCSPGPADFSLAAMGAAFGARSSLAYQAGSVLGVAVIMAVTASGLAALLLALPGVREAAVAALFSGFVLAESDPLADSLWKSAVLLGPILLATTLWVHLGALLARLATRPRTQRWINLGFALLIVVSTVVPFL